MSAIVSQTMDTPALSVVIETDNIETNELNFKVDNSNQVNSFPLSEVSNDANTIQCYMNQDNTLSYINNASVFQTVEDDCGEIYYACIGSTNEINQQDQVLQLIPQNQISSYIISDKDYSNINFLNDSAGIVNNSFYGIQNASYPLSKYHYENIDSNVFKSINCISKQVCEICSIEFPSKRTYLKHMSIHENDREFKCMWCKLSYNYEVNLLVHIAIIHTNECTIVNENNQETNYKCAICSCLFTRKKAHQAHCLIHQVDEELPCDYCSSSFKSKILLEKHLNDHKIGNDFMDNKLTTNYLKCKVCQEIFDNVGNIKKHYYQCHPKNKVQWSEDITGSGDKVEENATQNTDSLNTETGNKRKSSKIACQTIKLYAQGKSKPHPMKQESSKPINKRGRPKKTDSKNSKSNSCCSVCNKTFKTPILLRRHEVTHTGVKEFECPVCKKGFTQKSSVKIHMVVHDNVKGFSCKFCLKKFTYEHNMNTHIKVIHKNNGNASSQSQIHKDVAIRKEINETQLETANNRLQIEDTNKNIANDTTVNPSLNDDAEISQYLWNETQIENQISDNVCYQPNQSNDDIYVPSTPNFTKIDWDKSQQVTENRGILLSEDIERVDKETGQVQLHEVIKDQVTGFKRFRCRFCFKLYRKSCDLSRHVRIHTQQKPFQCYMCHKSFRLKSILKNHFKSHLKLKEYSCEVCNKIFNLKQTLKVHQQLHSPNKMRYSCPLCNKRFNTSFHFKYHSNNCYRSAINNAQMEAPKPESDKPIKPLIWNELLNQPVPIVDNSEKRKSNNLLFKCNHCGKSYKFKKYLNEHLKDHLSSNKTNICHFCNKSFVTFRSMQQHLRTQHLNRRKFSCSKCPAFFITKASLSRHGLVHSNLKPFACPLCFRRFKAKIYCDRHISARKCSKKRKLSNINVEQSMSQTTALHITDEVNPLSNHIDTEILTNDQAETFTGFRLEDLDMNSSQSSNILVTNYVNEFSGFPNTEKYMIVSLDNNQSNKTNPNNGHQHTINPCNQNNYYASNILIDDASLVDITRNQIDNGPDSSENIIGLLDGQIGVAPIDIGSIFTVQNYGGNISSLSAQLVDNNIQTDTNIDFSQQPDNIYYYQTINDISTECPEPTKGSLADKFPILKASLFSEDDCPDSKLTSNSQIYDHSNPTNSNQFIISTVNQLAPSDSIIDRNYSDPSQLKYYHGCANCDQQFKNSESLVHHVKIHHKIRKDFVCNVCHKAFSAKLSLWAHSKTHIESRSFGCLVCIACNQRFISVPSLSRHVRMQHNDNLNLYRCIHCNKVYKTTRELDSHIKQLVSEYDALIINSNFIENTNPTDVILTGHFSKTTQKPDVDIDKVYFTPLNSSQIDQIASLEVSNTSKLSVKELIKAAKETKGLKKCSKSSDSKSSLIDPLLTYPYSCSICHKGFNRASNLQQHLSVHTKLKPFQCLKCNNRFRHRCSLKTHEATKHSPITKLLRCHLCFKLLRSQIALRNHMKIHVRNYEFQCDECHKGFQTSQELLKHIKLKHNQSKDPMISNEKFNKTPVDLDQSNKELAPEIPKKLIKCLSCSFIFNTRSKYNSHYCARLSSLKPEQSQQNICCDKTFESTTDLLSHMQDAHHQMIQYNCAQCNIMFAQESSFFNHQKSVHHL